MESNNSKTRAILNDRAVLADDRGYLRIQNAVNTKTIEELTTNLEKLKKEIRQNNEQLEIKQRHFERLGQELKNLGFDIIIPNSLTNQ